MADARAAAMVAGFGLPDSPDRVNHALTTAIATLVSAMTVGAFTGTVFLDMKEPFLANPIVGINYGSEIILTPLPIDSIQIESHRLPGLQFYVAEIEWFLSVTVHEDDIDGFAKKHIGVFEHKLPQFNVTTQSLRRVQAEATFQTHKAELILTPSPRGVQLHRLRKKDLSEPIHQLL